MSVALLDPAVYFFSLNRRYSRSNVGKHIRYGYGSHVKLLFDNCVRQAEALAQFVAAYTILYKGLRSSKELMMLRLISDQLQTLLSLWREVITRGPNFGTGSEGDYSHNFLTERIDVDICEAFETLIGLEDSAEEMRIPGYRRYTVLSFDEDPCKCWNCNPPPGHLAWMWDCAQKYHSGLPPAIFQRMFGELRTAVANETSS